MIQSASSSSPSARNEAITAAAASLTSRPTKGAQDQIHIDKAATLRTILQQVPEVRPEVVQRARAMTSDPHYPSDAIIRQISALIVNSPDQSEDLT